MRPIDADALNEIMFPCRVSLYQIGWNGAVKSIMENAPTIDAKNLRPKGEWIDGMMCSECGQVDFTKPNFCPNCGADMRGEKDD